MTKKNIQTFFKAISDSDIDLVSKLLNADKEYLTVCNVAPPKKDDGQSGLQVAFKTGNFDIAKLLIEVGADVNFIEISKVNEWNLPVLHDSIRAAIFSSYTVQKDTSKFDKALLLLQLLLDKKANPNSTDSYGNNCLHRAILDSRQMLDSPNASIADGILIRQLKSVFKALLNAGADPNISNEKRANALEMINRFNMGQYNLW